jgi:hypothetical protein
MVDLTESAKPVPVAQDDEARRIWGENAIFCLGDNPDWGAGQHAPAWHHRAYHARLTQPRLTVAVSRHDVLFGMCRDEYRRITHVYPLPCVRITYRWRTR